MDSSILCEEDIEQLKVKIQSKDGFLVKDRRYLFKTYKNSFVGYEAVDWIYTNISGMKSREDSVKLGQKLLDTGIFSIVSGQGTDMTFKDDYVFFEFKKPSTTSPKSTKEKDSNITKSDKKVVQPSLTSSQVKTKSLEDFNLAKDELIQLGLDLINNERGLKTQKKKKNPLGATMTTIFTGQQMVDWLVKKLEISRKEATNIANSLMNLNIFMESPTNNNNNSSKDNQKEMSFTQFLQSLSSGSASTTPNLTTSTHTSPNVFSQGSSPLSLSTSSLPSFYNPSTPKPLEDNSDVYYEFLVKPESIINHVSIKKLDELCLAHKSLQTIPTTIINTSKYLKILDFSFNNLSDYNQLESVSTLFGLESCNLSHNDLNNLPSSFNRLEHLQRLNLSHNSFTQIPMVVFQIVSIRELLLASNHLTVISELIGRLNLLETFDLSNNKLSKIPKEIGLLSQLVRLNISGYNKITELPAFLSSIPTLEALEFNQETVKFPAKTITSKGFPHIIGYLRDLYEGTVTLPYLKLIVLGPEKSGKSSLIRSLTKSQSKATSKQGSSNLLKKVSSADAFSNDPFEITEWNLEIPEKASSSKLTVPGLPTSMSFGSLSSLQQQGSTLSNPLNSTIPSSPKEKKRSNSGTSPQKRQLKLLAYDFKFPSSEAYHHTHSFFLSERAFYLITFDINKDPLQSNLEFWINSIKSKAPNAPIYLVATMIDNYHQSANGDIMKPLSEVESFLNSRLLEVTGVIGISSQSNRNIDLLKQEIHQTLLQQSWINEKIPSIYLTLESNLQEEAKKRQPPIVSWDEYQNIAKMSNFANSTEKLIRATNTLNRWGSILWLDDSKSNLRDYVILKPQWLSDCFSQLVQSRHTLIGQDAILQLSSLRQIWKPNLIPESYHYKILKILERFQILYTLKNQQTSSLSPTSQYMESHDFHKSLPQLSLFNTSTTGSTSVGGSSSINLGIGASLNFQKETEQLQQQQQQQLPIVQGLNFLSLSSSSFVQPPQSSTTSSSTSLSHTPNYNFNQSASSSSPNSNLASPVLSSSSMGAFVHPSLIEHFSNNPLLNQSPKSLRNSFKPPAKPLSISSDTVNFNFPFNRVILPCLLPSAKPSQLGSLWDTWSGDDQHQIGRYFQFINSPRICFERLMVRFLYLMDPILYWSQGILFRKNQTKQETFKGSMTNCGTLVEYDSASRQLSILVRGPEFETCAKLFQIILEHVDTILKDYQIHLHHTYIPCSCSVTCRNSPSLYPMDLIESSFERGESSTKCTQTQLMVSLSKIAPDITLSSVSSTKKITKEDLVNLEEIGVGGFSKVYRGLFKGNQVVAIKQLNFERMDLTDPIQFINNNNNSISSTGTGSSFGQYSSLSSSGSIGRFVGSIQQQKLLHRHESASSISSTSSDKSEDSSITQSRLTAINEFRREVWLMSSLSHPNIVPMKGFCFQPYSIVMEYMDLGNLSTYLLAKKQEGTTLSWPVILKIASDVASGMSYLHNSTPPLVHRDLKSPNILLSTIPDEPYITAKVSDFGLSRSVVQGFVSKVVDNPTWLAPEVLKAHEYNEKGDVYSFGMILWELYHMEIPFDEYDFKFMSTLEDNIVAGLRPTIRDNCNAQFADLITRCWNSDPFLRPSFDHILKHLQEIQLSYNNNNNTINNNNTTIII
ncbi:leucine-rich repeat-containing protein (LRR) [Tieghemostelium lacteum]|uniref:non-specific serine/threonine protein kinase n=1 Tax=Tieghemostelium lacteum TaxID=361077 RepID=A0A151ZIE9_TIELA|nr:leucine-rich repeat-containing protein (LRR) [Tieghemostelium lacteum]|eukprot:KYQ93736.1 leucine-rich repeat-containing protein (LRR) [Tieghemostelium lacteum]